MAKYGYQPKSLRFTVKRSYEVQTQSGGIYRRTRRLLRKTNESFPDITDFEPNILAQTFSKVTPNTNPHRYNLDQEINRSASPINDPYQTRSGRVVKPNKLIVVINGYVNNCK
ncbi:hypothetical protein DPMN_119583 [Dreissena polymorpha]|uniref:Uncharacterized protein n=1 Tax=Dreissena polymorpha TaxID=45954 RepID=A0A9D4JRD5_DREPO|nr:hypothetical protein DPMN_119583 [Dreissena polymorpha]